MAKNGAMAKGGHFKKNSARSKARDISDDDIDAFHGQREKILLHEDSDQDQYGSNDDQEEMVMNISEDESEDESWGRNKKTFYNGDVAEEDLADEVREAKKLQTKQLASLKADDFGVSRVTGRKSSGPVTLSSSEESENDEEARDATSDMYASESELADLKGENLEALLPEEEKLELIKLHAPETRQFLEEFRRRVREIKESIEPVLEQLAGKDTSKGLSFLETKYQLLIGYCANLAYYLLLKVQGKSIERHPVVERLVKYRLLIEKIKPMEAKLQYQIDKLLHAAKNEGGRTNLNEDEKALAFRPNMEMFMQGSGGEEEASEAEEEHDGIYRAPKVAPAHFAGGSKSGDKLEERQKMLASKSRLLADVQADFEDRPEEESIDPVYGGAAIISSSKRREEYEEDNFLRVTLSKKEQRKLERMQAKPTDELEDLNDFFRESEKPKSANGRGAVERLLGMKSRAKKGVSGDEDVPKKAKTLKQGSRRQEEVPSDMSEIEDDMDGEDEMYKAAKNRSSAKKTKSQPNGPVSYKPIRDLKGDDARPASREMIKNRGLTPYRPKETRNPRVKQRNKWEKAQKKIKSFKAVASTQAKPYSGEATGIRTNISRSVKF